MAGLDEVLADHTIIGLDTNPFIYFVTNDRHLQRVSEIELLLLDDYVT